MAAEFRAETGLTIGYESVDPTGEPCFFCGDVPLLRAWIEYVAFNGRRGEDPTYICEDCKDERDDSDDG